MLLVINYQYLIISLFNLKIRTIFCYIHSLTDAENSNGLYLPKSHCIDRLLLAECITPHLFVDLYNL